MVEDVVAAVLEMDARVQYLGAVLGWPALSLASRVHHYGGHGVVLVEHAVPDGLALHLLRTASVFVLDVYALPCTERVYAQTTMYFT